MPLERLARFLALPELKITKVLEAEKTLCIIRCEKENLGAVCPKCATFSRSTYDRRIVRLKDDPVRDTRITLSVRKRRYWCKTCQKPFTEPLPGVLKRRRHTERYGRSLRYACEVYSDLKRVRHEYRCSAGFLYKTYYRHLELRRRKRQYAWPNVIGIDEHAFGKNPATRQTRFASLVIDYRNKRAMEVVEGKTQAALEVGLSQIPGRENVRYVTLDLADPFKNFAKSFFPHAELIADKFHVLRLLSPALMQKRQEITGTRADLKAKKLLLMSWHELDYGTRLHLERFLERYPVLRELHQWKEAMHRFYRTRGYNKACFILTRLTDQMALSTLPEIKTLRRTLMKWREEILNYFKTGLTNARVEGFNNKAKVVKRRGYGYRSFTNYRLRLLDALS